MNKSEVKKLEKVCRYADDYMERNNINPENFEYVHLIDLMDEYAQQVSRDTAIDFAAYLDSQDLIVNKAAAADCFDEWYFNQTPKS